MKNISKKTKYLISGIMVLVLAFSICGCEKSGESLLSTGSNDESDGNVLNDEVIDKTNDIQDIIDENFYFEEDIDNVEENVYKGMMEGLDDPYSVYYTPEEYTELMEDTSGEYVGIGVQVNQDPETMLITVTKVFKDGPASKVGIKKGDIITAVDDWELAGEEVEQVVKKIKGKEGSMVKITVYREGEHDYLEFDTARQMVENPTVEYRMLADDIGYISVASFYDVTADQYKAAVEDLKSQGMKGLIVDLRDNPGGLLTTVVDMLDYMLPEGKLVYTEDKDGNILEEFDSTDEEQFTLPLVVMINENSASASEIYAGAIKDYGAGKLVGIQTFGKGIVQRIFDLGDGSALKLTIAKYFTPNGNDIHEIGVAPDVEVELSDEAKEATILDETNDNQLQKGIEVLKEEMK